MSDIFNVMTLTIKEEDGETVKQFRTKFSYNLVMEQHVEPSGGRLKLKQWWSSSQPLPTNVSDFPVFEQDYLI